jgi:hypothetical protein
MGFVVLLCAAGRQKKETTGETNVRVFAANAKMVFAGLGDAAYDRRVQREHAAGRLRRIHNGIYTTSLDEPDETVARNHVFLIVGYLFPRSVVSAQSAQDEAGAGGQRGRSPGWAGLTLSHSHQGTPQAQPSRPGGPRQQGHWAALGRAGPAGEPARSGLPGASRVACR